MARKKRKKTSGRKSGGRRVRGAGGSDALLFALGGILGGVGMMYATQKVTFLQGKLMGFVQALVGTLIVWKIGMPFAKGLGVGIAVSGGNTLGKSFGLLTGIGASREFRRSAVTNGFREVPKIGAFPKPNVVGKPDMSRVYAGVYN